MLVFQGAVRGLPQIHTRKGWTDAHAYLKNLGLMTKAQAAYSGPRVAETSIAG